MPWTGECELAQGRLQTRIKGQTHDQKTLSAESQRTDPAVKRSAIAKYFKRLGCIAEVRMHNGGAMHTTAKSLEKIIARLTCNSLHVAATEIGSDARIVREALVQRRLKC
jgi:hypothetical protein